MQFKKVTLTIPERLHDECKKMIESGYFANFSDIVRAGIRAQLEVYLFPKRNEDWFERFAMLTTPSQLKDKEIIDRLRKSREEIWSEKYAGRFG